MDIGLLIIVGVVAYFVGLVLGNDNGRRKNKLIKILVNENTNLKDILRENDAQFSLLEATLKKKRIQLDSAFHNREKFNNEKYAKRNFETKTEDLPPLRMRINTSGN